ncbi:Fe-S cluster assembly sulfur transfer protein SufU [Sneathiella chinensis]|uniref:Iron-sulfur cluster assembly scaffold protein n=1 Tax=Sneathiella chinensis TaxID=349750 RepID=A0ABQ5U4Z4_9PROT|nr:SUF system NifU family Fe-S cluster assembly protein [Sneathiella chinensis]GLQ06974.1 iron-sulfur cluster assembly scaffold protein [Sneathiella chinensis]
MQDTLRELYQEVILDHSKHPRNFGRPETVTCEAHGYNPLCGDTIDVFLTLNENGLIEKAAFEGKGCAISMASASMLTELVKGKTADEAHALFRSFHDLVTGATEELGADEEAEKLMVLAGVKAFPMRVKCATLSWHALEAALKGNHEATTE